MGNSSSKKKKDKESQSSSTSSSSSSISSSPAVVDDSDDVKTNTTATELKVDEGSAKAETASEVAYSWWDRDKTIRPQRQIPELQGQRGRVINTMKATMKATLGGGDLLTSVKLPQGEELNEWIAVNTVQFFNAANLIYGTCRQCCTDQSCSVMAAGKAVYLWKDDSAMYKKPTQVSAPVYIDLALTWMDDQITNPAVFPIDENDKFPRNFMSIIKVFYKRLFRLYAHLYTAHHEYIKNIGANAHLNTCFKHLVYFIMEFKLVDMAEMQPLEKLINKFIDTDKNSKR